MRAIKSLAFISCLGLAVTGGFAAQTQLKISQSLPLRNPNNQCISPAFDLAHGKATFEVTSKCPDITAIMCTYRSARAAWDCETPMLAAGQTWRASFPAEPSAVYLVGACKKGNADCEAAQGWLYSHVIGRPRELDPVSLHPPPSCSEGDLACQNTNAAPAPPPPPAPERG